jgi:Tol biopolymer transport system component
MSRTMSRVRSNSGGQPDNNSALPDISGNGKRIAFASSATNLITSPPTGNSIFFADQTITGEWRVSGRLPLDSGGNPVATKPSISNDGIVVVYNSRTSSLNKFDIFYTRLDATAIAQPQSYRLTNGDQDSTMPKISDDGCIVTFKSATTNLVPGADPSYQHGCGRQTQPGAIARGT